MFGASSEKTQHDAEQLPFFNEVEMNQEPLFAEPTEKTVKDPSTKKSRKKTFENLPIEVISYEIDEKCCPNCNNFLHVMSQEVRNELIIIPAQVKLLKHTQNIYVCRSCSKEGIKGSIISAKAPKALISKSLVSPSLMSYIMYRKYANALHLDRQSKDFKRLGVTISCQNMSNWVTIHSWQLCDAFAWREGAKLRFDLCLQKYKRL